MTPDRSALYVPATIMFPPLRLMPFLDEILKTSKADRLFQELGIAA
jgi:hypothetical protein